MLIFALTVAFAPPLLALLAERLAEAVRRGWGARLHDALRLVALTAIALGVLNELDELMTTATSRGAPGWLLVVLAVACGCGALAMLRRSGTWRSFARFLAPAAPVVLFFFLTSVPIGSPAASPSTAASRPAPIVMVVMDELPTTSLWATTAGSTPRGCPTSPGWRARAPSTRTRPPWPTRPRPPCPRCSAGAAARSGSRRPTWRRGRATCSRCWAASTGWTRASP